MARNARISIISQPPCFPAPTDDYNALQEQINAHVQFWLDKVLPDKPDLIVVPEVVDAPRGWAPEKANPYYRWRGNRSRDYFSRVARENNCYIAYSAVRYIPEDEPTGHPFRNSTQILGRDGSVVGVYDKNHLTMGEYDLCERAYGTEAPIIELDFGRVCCAICFDLNFTELLARYIPQKPDLILFQSMYHGGFVQKEWAYNCRAYLASAIGDDRYPDGSGTQAVSNIRDPFGEIVTETTGYVKYATATVNFDRVLAHLDGNGAKIEAAKRKYGPLLRLTEPGRVGSWLMTYEGTDRTAADIAREFDILPLDDYLDACRAHRAAHLPR